MQKNAGLESENPERTPERTFEVDAETEAVLLESIAQCRRGQTTPIASLLAELRSRE